MRWCVTEKEDGREGKMMCSRVTRECVDMY